MKKRSLYLILFFVNVIIILMLTDVKNLFLEKDKKNISSKSPSVSNLIDENQGNGENQENGENQGDDIQGNDNQENNGGITKEQMLEDFNYMVATIEESSPFWGVMERKNLTSTWERLKLQYREDIKTNDFDIMFFYGRLGRFLNNFPIGHLDIMTSKMYRIHYDHILASAYGEGYNDAWRKALLYDKTIEFYGNLDKGILGSSENSLQEAEEVEEQADINFSPYKTEILEEGKTALLQIDSFLYPPKEEQQQELLDFYRSISKYENLIIDITKNKGGNTAYWADSIVLPNLKETLTYDSYVLYRDTPLIQKYYSERIKEYQIDMQEVKPLFTHENALDYDLLDIAVKTTDIFEPILKEPLFTGKIWLLTSKQNYSSSEIFARFCKATGFATLVGKKTIGSGVGTSLFFPLPNSGILVRFDAAYGLNEDGTSQFETGTEPDYYADGDPLEECLSIIERGTITKN